MFINGEMNEYAALKKAVETALDTVYEKDKIINGLLTITVTEKIEVDDIIKLIDDILHAMEISALAWRETVDVAEKWIKTKGPKAFLKWTHDRLHQAITDVITTLKIKNELMEIKERK
jgi:hypothetical protein